MSNRDRRISALATLAVLLFPSTADAVLFTPGAGVTAGVSFLQRKVSFNLTVEAYVTAGWDRPEFREGCYASPAMAVGPMAAMSLVKDGSRFILGAIGGGTIGQTNTTVGGELGVVRTTAEGSPIGLHVGANAGLSNLTAVARVEGFREASLSAGVWYLPPYGGRQFLCAIPGRPRRDEDGRRIGAPMTEGWTKEAQQEADSVLAFLDLAQALLEADAPDALVDAALDSAEDEIRHALLCAREARAMPALPAFEPRAALRGREALDRIATESFHDGWINEGRAARDAHTRSKSAHGSARASLTIIARDEARHARVGRAITAWAIDRGGHVAYR